MNTLLNTRFAGIYVQRENTSKDIQYRLIDDLGTEQFIGRQYPTEEQISRFRDRSVKRAEKMMEV